MKIMATEIFRVDADSEISNENKKNVALTNILDQLHALIQSDDNELSKVKDWGQTADDIKKEGFYVDYKDSWLSPTNVRKETYSLVKDQADFMLLIVKEVCKRNPKDFLEEIERLKESNTPIV